MIDSARAIYLFEQSKEIWTSQKYRKKIWLFKF